MIGTVDLVSGQESPWTISSETAEVFSTPKVSNFVLSAGRSLEGISYDLYGDVKYWDVLARYNDIVNPLNLPEKIYVLTFQQVARVGG